MGRDGLRVGVQIIRKFVIRPFRICFRSVYNHPFLVGILLMFLYLYRSLPFLFQLLVSASPVLVCTAVLLGILLSFGEHNISTLVEEDEKKTPEMAGLKTAVLESRTVVAKDESLGEDSAYTELISEIMERSLDEEPLLDIVDRAGKYEGHDDLVIDSVPSYHVSREIEFGKQLIHEEISEFVESEETGEVVNLGNQKTGIEFDVGLNHEILVDRSFSPEMGHAENNEVYMSAEGPIDVQLRNHLEPFMASERQMSDVLRDKLSSGPEVDIKDDNLKNDKTSEKSIDDQIRDRLESSSGSWTQFEVLQDRLSSVRKIQVDNLEDYISGEGSVDAQIGSPLELSLGSWNHLDSDHDRDDESDSGSDGAESSSPDASMADIIPMLDELHPLLEDENPHISNLSSHGSAASDDESDEEEIGDVKSDGEDDNEEETRDGKEDSAKSVINWTEEGRKNLMELGTSELERNQRLERLIARRKATPRETSELESEEEDAGDVKSDGEDDNEEQTQDGKEDSAKSAINWTEEDQKNLMELGTSELERNQRLESLIARRRARRMVTERNLLDLEGMDLSFPIAPISTTRYNPFDNAHDSYADLGLPPIPGSAPSVMVKRQNPFDLPYDSSEEKPDLTGDSFQEEFMELGQRESTNHRLFKRNETFSMGSSIFDFGRQVTRASRFRPYFVPERTDSDVMSYSSFERQYSELSESRLSYSSLQRQSSEFSESKASSAADTDMTYTVRDHDEKKLFEHEPGQGLELRPEIGHPSDYVEHGSQCSDDLGSLSDEGNDTKEVDHHLPVVDLIAVGNSLVATTYTSEAGQLDELRESGKGNDLEVDHEQSERELSSSEVQFVGELINHSSSSSLSVPKEHDGPKDEDDDRGLVNNKVHDLENIIISLGYSFEASVSTDHLQEEPEFGHATEAAESHPKEPIYDSSPLAIKRNPSSSSISSDLQRGTSEIDLYHVQRDLFAEDESKIHDKVSEDNAPLRRQELDDGGCSANEVTEVTEHSSTGSRFAGLIQQSTNSLASSEAEYDFHVSEDSSAKEFSKKELLDDKISLNEAEQVLTKGNNVEGQHAGKLDISVADMSFEDEYKSSTDLLVPLQEKQSDILGDHISSIDSNLSSSEVELKEEIGAKVGGSEHFLASISSMSNHDNDASKELLFALDESHFFPHDSVFYDPQKQVKSAIHFNLEEFGQVNKVGETANVLKVQEPEENMFFTLLQNNESSELEKLEKISVSEMVAENNTTRVLDKSVADELIMCEEMNDMKEMDEELLSELDAVGDFSVKNISLNLNKTYLVAEVNSVIPEEVEADVHFSSGIQFGDSTSLVDIIDTQNSESASVSSETKLAWSKESISDSHMGDVNTGLFVLEHKSSEDIDTAFKTGCEEEAQTFVPDESVQAEGIIVNESNLTWSKESIPDLDKGDANFDFLTLEEQSVEDINVAFKKLNEEEVQKSVAVEPILQEERNQSDLNLAWSEDSIPDTPIGEANVGLLVIKDQSVEDINAALTKVEVESTKPMCQATEDMSLLETTLNDKESVPERSELNLALPKGHILDSLTKEPESRISMDKEMSELSGEDFEDLKTDIGESIAVEALDTMAEPGTESEKSLPLHIDSSLRDLQDSPAEETVIGDQIERSGSEDLKLLLPDIDIKKMAVSSILEACTSNTLEPGDQLEGVGSIGCDSLEKDIDVKDTQELPALDASIAPVECVDQRERVAAVESDHESPVEASLANASESECQIEPEGVRDFKTLLTHTSIGLIRESPIVEANISCDDECEEQTQSVGQLETEKPKNDGDFKGIEESPVVEVSVASTVDLEDDRDISSPLETEEVQDVEDHLLASQQKSEIGVPMSDDSEGSHAVSLASVSQSNKKDPGGQGSKRSVGENFSSQVEEERAHESHLEFSSSSSSSSSSSN